MLGWVFEELFKEIWISSLLEKSGQNVESGGSHSRLSFRSSFFAWSSGEELLYCCVLCSPLAIDLILRQKWRRFQVVVCLVQKGFDSQVLNSFKEQLLIYSLGVVVISCCLLIVLEFLSHSFIHLFRRVHPLIEKRLVFIILFCSSSRGELQFLNILLFRLRVVLLEDVEVMSCRFEVGGAVKKELFVPTIDFFD